MSTVDDSSLGRFLRGLLGIHNGLISALAVVCFCLIGVMPFLVTYDAIARTVGLQPPLWSVPVIEYALLFIVVMGAPWLLRRNGHVTIEVLTMQLSTPKKVVLERVAYLMSAASCATTAYFGSLQAYAAFRDNTYDVRSIAVPESMIYFLLAVGFLLLSVEFALQGIRGKIVTETSPRSTA